MNAARRTENTTVRLRLAMTAKTTDELFVIIADTDAYSLAERKAAQVVIDVRERKAFAAARAPLRA